MSEPITLAQVRNAGFWRDLLPGLNVTEQAHTGIEPGPDLNQDQLLRVREDLIREGYVQFDGFYDQALCARLAKGVHVLKSRDLLPVFSLIYDDYWLLSRRLFGLLQSVLGPGYAQLPDFWSWYIDPAREERGWPPHRDKGAAQSLLPDGMPKSCTAWIPLTDATPINGCMYIVPAYLDPSYLAESTALESIPMQSVRALPARAGSLIIWNQRVMHWGGNANRRARIPRISVAFEFQRGDIPPFNEPLLEPQSLPSFNTRLSLIGKQILQYTHMYGYNDTLVQAAKAMHQGSAHSL